MNGTHYPREMERINKDGSLERIKIPGGWLVRSKNFYIHGDHREYCSESMIEIKDSEHNWVLENPVI